MLEKWHRDERNLPQSYHILWLHHHPGRGRRQPDATCLAAESHRVLLNVVAPSSLESLKSGNNMPGNQHMKPIGDRVHIRLNLSLRRNLSSFRGKEVLELLTHGSNCSHTLICCQGEPGCLALGTRRKHTALFLQTAASSAVLLNYCTFP